jgi:hypothetical protein
MPSDSCCFTKVFKVSFAVFTSLISGKNYLSFKVALRLAYPLAAINFRVTEFT